jgi:hypothetical protein
MEEDPSMEDSEMESRTENSSGRAPDLGGLGGQPPGIPLVKAPTLAERRLKSHIKFFKSKYPHVDLNKCSEIEHALLGLNEPELRDILESIKSQVGGLSPFASIEKVIQFGGLAAETKFNMPGFQSILSNDPDLVSALDELTPTAFHSLAAPLQIAWSMVQAGLSWMEQQANPNETNARRGDKRKTSEETKAPASKRQKKADRAPPRSSLGDGEVSDGEDHLGSEAHSESL